MYETFLVLAQIDGILEHNVDYLDLRVYNFFFCGATPQTNPSLPRCVFYKSHIDTDTHTHTAGRTPLNK